MQYKQQHNDSWLADRLANGDHDAFSEFYSGFYPVLYRYALKILKLEPLAQDVTTEIFLTLWQKRGELKPVQSLRAYLLTAVRNRSINVLKEQSRSQVAMNQLRHQFEQKSINSEECLLTKEYIAFIKTELENLPARARQVFNLCREEGRSYDEVASELGISRNAVKGHMVYSMKKLKTSAQKKLGISFVLLFYFFASF